jgi:hypothetical protein
MKKIALVVLILIVASSMVFAQGKMEGTRFGMGVSFGKESIPQIPYPIGLLDFPTFYLPVQLGSMFRVEPEFGYYSFKESNSTTSTYSTMIIGIGLFYTKWYGKCDIYMGGRFQYWMWKYKEENGTSIDESRTDYMFGPAIGAECWCCDHISFGGELQFNYMNIGQFENGTPAEDITTTVMKFKGLFFIRWWF